MVFDKKALSLKHRCRLPPFGTNSVPHSKHWWRQSAVFSCPQTITVTNSTSKGWWVRWPQSTLSLLRTICSLLRTICSLLRTICSLLRTICSLLRTNYSLLRTNCSLLRTNCSLLCTGEEKKVVRRREKGGAEKRNYCTLGPLWVVPTFRYTTDISGTTFLLFFI